MLTLPRSALLSAALLAACSAASGETPARDPGEPAAEAELGGVDDRDETAAGDAIGLDRPTGYVDVRGVGDSAWARTHVTPALPARFGAALDAFDASGKSYRGHLSFINWESVIADDCQEFSKPYVPNRYYAFVSRADNVAQAIERGFNLIGLANNHTRDCNRTSAGIDGVESTRRAAVALASRGAIFHGVSAEADETTPAIAAFDVAGRAVKVAFGSVYLGIESGTGVTASGDLPALMAAMKAAAVDLRILALHSVDAGNQEARARAGRRFIEEFGGDVVFGHGPHVWRPVRVLRKPDGRPGVVFESLGNYLDPALATQPKNYVGRALFDRRSMRLSQVQLLAVENRGESLEKSDADPAEVSANLRWQHAPSAFGPLVYANVRE